MRAFIGVLSLIGFIGLIENSYSKNVEYKVADSDYEGYLLKGKAKLPLVILLHDWDGLTSYEKKRAGMLHKLGYSVFAADLFGKGIRPTKLKDKKQHTGELYKDRNKLRNLMAGALRAARANGVGNRKIVVMGYCFGGAAALEWSRSGVDFAGFVTFHGGLQTPSGQDYSKAKGHYQIFHGTSDKMISMKHYSDLAIALDKNGLSHEMVNYGGAPHAFTVFGSDRYRKVADKNSWAQFVSFLRTLH